MIKIYRRSDGWPPKKDNEFLIMLYDMEKECYQFLFCDSGHFEDAIGGTRGYE